VARRRSGSSATKPRRRQHPIAVARAPQTPARVGVGPNTSATATTENDEPQALVVSYSFDSGESGEPYDAVVRLTGRRIGVTGVPKRGDSFSQDETVSGVIPGTGTVALTVWVYGLRPGEWSVDARLMPGPGADRLQSRPRPGSPARIERATWSWRRWALAPAPERPVKTRWALLAPLARQPAVIPGIYTALAIVGFAVALALQAAILARDGIAVGPPLAASLIAIVAGLVGAKAWYAVLHPDESLIKGGWAVDGFLVVFPLVGALMLYAWDLPIGKVFDSSTPGIFIAVALGRVGCFLTGCCAGRCTAARWGIWSSDRRVGARRIPTQLIESGAGLAIGVVSFAVVLAGGLPIAGAVFVFAFALYSLIRQVLLRLRAERRKSYRTLPITAAAAGVVAFAVAALSLLQSS
jgi:phosphatidylglycerol---prolipoprotein diacylglyceryl transferase